MKKAYGGVVIDEAGRVLLREPAGHFKGRVWTFAKGKPKPGESPEETALREVLEETGILAQIIGKIPGEFNGSTVSNEYFLMRPVVETGTFDGETQAIAWVDARQARELIRLTIPPQRRRRDLRVLKVGFRLFKALQTLQLVNNERSFDLNPGSPVSSF